MVKYKNRYFERLFYILYYWYDFGAIGLKRHFFNEFLLYYNTTKYTPKYKQNEQQQYIFTLLLFVFAYYINGTVMCTVTCTIWMGYSKNPVK